MQDQQAATAAITALAKIDPLQPLGTDLYNGVARVSVNVAIETVCIRRNDSGVIEVLMTRQDDTHVADAGLWQSPGSIKRPGESEQEVVARLEKDEFHAKITSRRKVGECYYHRIVVGHIDSHVFLCTVEEENAGTWHPVNNLPKNTSPPHILLIVPMATIHFLAQHVYTDKDIALALASR